MAVTNIDIELNDVSIEHAIKQLEAYRRDMVSKLNDLVARLGQLGLTVINARLTGWAYPGGSDVHVRTSFNGNTCVITAHGDDVAFIEFGAGVYFPEGEYSGIAGVSHGTYGEGQGKNPKGWVYTGEQGDPSLSIPAKDRAGNDIPGKWRTWGNDPANAFPLGVKEIQDNVERLAREVFK